MKQETSLNTDKIPFPHFVYHDMNNEAIKLNTQSVRRLQNSEHMHNNGMGFIALFFISL